MYQFISGSCRCLLVVVVVAVVGVVDAATAGVLTSTSTTSTHTRRFGDVPGFVTLKSTSRSGGNSVQQPPQQRQQQQKETFLPPLHRSPKNDIEEPPIPVRFLGRGPNAIVRPGCVLVAPKHEFHHFYRQSAIFIHAMGEDDTLGSDIDRDYFIRGVILDYPTPFTLAEMMDQNTQMKTSPLGENFLFRGGDKGQEGVILLHNQPNLLQQQQQDITNVMNQVGDSGVFQGGWEAALKACDGTSKGEVNDNFKAFFNYCEFSEGELEDLLDSEEDGDGWVSVEVSPEFILDQDWDKGDAWKRLRNALVQMNAYDKVQE
eukprot:CAMPEP_0198142592 /NCGR_PEP_ID=MMETSP1443-20131203/5346_1 /TAXON_ID=186043 /ORGANISM="Entomoneis sp., Strain CCMP2396" /LENGTH=316 /DNA_ID=CAMNT_0043805639 /DNA_START=167 /DNA_END=1117 /DNA_ORIENTATION=+